MAAANDPLTGVRSVFGTVRRVTEGTPENAELASINQSYKATQRNYSHLAQLIEHLPIGYLRVNILRDKSGEAVDYLLSYINQQAGRILGIHTQGHAGKTAREVGIDPLKHIPTFEHIPSCSFWEQTGKSPDGKRTCRCLIYNTPGDDDELVILLEDITDATRSREQLDDFEHLFNLVSDFAHVGCVSYNPLTGEGYTKGPWAKNYGEAENTPASQILGHWRQVHPDDRQHLEEEFERLKTGEIRTFVNEVRIVSDQEPMRWIKIHLLCRDYRPEEGVIDLACVNYDISELKRTEEEELREACKQLNVEVDETFGKGKLIDAIFGQYCEEELIQPTFITDYPREMSPLCKRHRSNPDLTERFELFVNGKELCNAYSELNDPIDQLERFQEQLRLSEKGDDEAMFIDMDFVRALEYGMPTCSGMGIGIDRLTMFMTDQSSIQDVLFFPQMRPEKKVVNDPAEAYTAIGVPEEWVPVIQKMGYLTVESLRKLAPGKFFNDLCGFNKKNKLGLKAPSIDEVKGWCDAN